MEVLIAILWYLQVVFCGTSYTTTQFDAMVKQNQPKIQAIQADQQKTSNIYNSYMNNSSHDVNLVEPWDDDPPPIRN